MVIAALGQGYDILLLALFLFPISMHFLAAVLREIRRQQVTRPVVNLYVESVKPVKFPERKPKPVEQKVKIIKATPVPVGTPKDIIEDGIRALVKLQMRHKDAVRLVNNLIKDKTYTSLNELVLDAFKHG